MATTTFTVRQFFNVPSEEGAFARPASTFVVTGSISRLLVNGGRTNLASDSFTINGNTYNSVSPQGWWPAGTNPAVFDVGVTNGGIIVGGNDSYANSSPDGRVSEVSVWGWVEGETQGANDTKFIELAGSVLNSSYETTGSAKAALQAAGFYYQYPVGFDGQSPNTGTGSDT